jgi:hypothetical protein
MLHVCIDMLSVFMLNVIVSNVLSVINYLVL